MAGYGGYGSSLRDLPRLRESRRGRESSWDRTGGNRDFTVIEPGEKVVLADLSGAGCINHIWMTSYVETDGIHDDEQRDHLRKLVLRVTWDGETSPSILVPLGDFFGALAPTPAQYVSAPIQVGPAGGGSLSCWWHMPFADGARVELVSELDSRNVRVFHYVDYELYDALEQGIGRFHALWRRENPCEGESEEGRSNDEHLFGGVNLSGDGNYTILEADGRGHYVGCILTLHNLRQTNEWNWYGEGDDMIFVDGQGWPPTLHGTGTEDYFDTAFCPNERFSGPYHGLIHAGSDNWHGCSSHYRFHIEDPIPFERSIRVTVEHGHANRRSDDYSSVAFWYQEEPHREFALAPVGERIPHPR